MQKNIYRNVREKSSLPFLSSFGQMKKKQIWTLEYSSSSLVYFHFLKP